MIIIIDLVKMNSLVFLKIIIETKLSLLISDGDRIRKLKFTGKIITSLLTHHRSYLKITLLWLSLQNQFICTLKHLHSIRKFYKINFYSIKFVILISRLKFIWIFRILWIKNSLIHINFFIIFSNFLFLFRNLFRIIKYFSHSESFLLIY